MRDVKGWSLQDKIDAALILLVAIAATVVGVYVALTGGAY